MISTVTSNINYASPRYQVHGGGAFVARQPPGGWGQQQTAQQAPPFTPPPAQPQAPAQPQQPSGNQLDDRTRQPSTLISYLEGFRGQKNFFSGRSDSEAAARKQQAEGGQSALSQQLGNPPAQQPAMPAQQPAAEPARQLTPAPRPMSYEEMAAQIRAGRDPYSFPVVIGRY